LKPVKEIEKKKTDIINIFKGLKENIDITIEKIGNLNRKVKTMRKQRNDLQIIKLKTISKTLEASQYLTSNYTTEP
jgi:CBS-domain-containing membrane protein